jgi:hypothetical protein
VVISKAPATQGNKSLDSVASSHFRHVQSSESMQKSENAIRYAIKCKIRSGYFEEDPKMTGSRGSWTLPRF